MMKIGFDTGFFIEIIKGNKKAEEWLNKLLIDDFQGVISCLTLYELQKYYLKGIIKKEIYENLSQNIYDLFEIVWLDSKEKLLESANLSHGIGLHMSDSIILNSFLISGCTTIVSTDKHILPYQKKGLEIIKLDK